MEEQCIIKNQDQAGPILSYTGRNTLEMMGTQSIRQDRLKFIPNFTQQVLWKVWSCALCKPGSCRSSSRDKAFWAPGDRPVSSSAQSSIHSDNTGLADRCLLRQVWTCCKPEETVWLKNQVPQERGWGLCLASQS